MDELRKQFPITVEEIANKDNNIFVILGDISHGIFANFRKKYKQNYLNIGILEPTMISMSAGMSKAGITPIVHTIAPFIIERSLEQLKLDYGYHNLSGNIVTVGGTFDYSALGTTHHCYDDISIIKTIQNTEIFYPGTTKELDLLLKKNYKNKNLSFYKLPKKGHSFDFTSKEIHSKNGILANKGNKITIVCVSTLLDSCFEAVKKLDLSADIIYLPKVYPININTIYQSIKKTGKLFILQDTQEHGGIVSVIINQLSKINALGNISIGFKGIHNKFIDKYGSYEEILSYLGIDNKGITKSISDFIKNN